MYLLSKERSKKIFDLSYPIILGMLSQNLLNLVDIAMVGRLGSESIAATGISGMICFLIQAPILGVSSGVQAISARKKGEGKINETGHPLNTALIFSIVFGIVLTVLSLTIAPFIFSIVVDDIEVRKIGLKFFDARIISTIFVVMNYAFRGFFSAVDLPKVYMKTLVIMHGTNIILNYLLIYGKFGFPRLEAFGSGVATSISITIGTIIYFLYAKETSAKSGFLKKLPSLNDFSNLCRISFPSGAELFVTMASVVAEYWLIGKIGTDELAGINILMNLLLVILLPAVGLGFTLATLSGQALGREDLKDSKAWGFDILKAGLAGFLILAIPLLLFPDKILGLFTNDKDVIKTAESSVRLMGITLPFEMLGFIFMDGIKGIGDTKTVFIASFIFQWVFFFPVACILVFIFHLGLFQVWILQTIYHLTQSIYFIKVWNDGKWQKIKVS